MPIILKRNLSALLISSLIIWLYFYLWNTYAINIPKWDDHAITGSVIKFQASDSFIEKLNEIFKQHNEHRIAFTRLVAIIDFQLFNLINFKHLMLVGNLGLVVIWWVLIRFFRTTIAPVWYALPVVMFWFTLAHWENIFWGMAAIQNIWVVAFALLSFWVLRRNDNRWWWAVVFAFFAVFTSGNGFLVLPVGLFVLLLQKKYSKATIWTILSVVILLLYFKILNYEAPPALPKIPIQNQASIFLKVRRFFEMAGSISEGLPFGKQPFQMPYLNGVLNIFVSFCLLLYILRNYFQKHFKFTDYDYFYVGGTLFALGTLLLVTYSRIHTQTDTLLYSRYKPYSALMLSLNLAYLTIIVNQKFRDSLTFVFLVGTSFLFVCNQHYHLYDTINLRKYLVSDAYGYTATANPNDKNQNIYYKPKSKIDDLGLMKLTPSKDTITFSRNWQLGNVENKNLLDEGNYLLFKGKQSYLYPYQQLRKHSFRNILNYRLFFDNRATIDLTDYKFDADIYQVYDVLLKDRKISTKTKGTMIVKEINGIENRKMNW